MKTKMCLVAAFATCTAVFGGTVGKYFEELPEGCDPATVSRKVTDQFLSTRPENYHPAGYHGNSGYGWNRIVQYSVVSLWINAIECARLEGDKRREELLVRLYDDFLPGRTKHYICSRPYHVDDTIFGAVPLAVYLGNRDERCLKQGLAYADNQWCAPNELTFKERESAKPEVQRDYYEKGYSVQTRLWIDDMYMITVLQSQAFRATGDRKYIDRAAKEMVLYLDKLQLKEGPAKSLFYHAPDVPFVWSRGDGWMAAGMALLLERLPEDNPDRPAILRGYRDMMAALLKFQRPDGLWSQLIDRPDDPRNWGESSSTAMFTYAFVVGVERGWLDAATYGPAARRAYLALVSRFDDFGNVSDCCVGTGKRNDLEYYFKRARVHGDPHVQAPMLWIASALLQAKAGTPKGMRTPATSKHFERRIDPVSGVVSYALSGGRNQNYQSVYFTAKSMTDDGRFLLFDISPTERKPRTLSKHKALIDFATDELIDLPGINGQLPYVDVKDDYMIYVGRDGAFFKLDFRNPRHPVKLCDAPRELPPHGRINRYFTHLTLNHDRTKAFLDLGFEGNNRTWVQGTLDLATGAFEPWTVTDFLTNHGQINPVRDDVAMCAWEECWQGKGAEYKRKTGWYPRMWLMYKDGRKEMIPSRVSNHASHEIWDEDGKGFSWCSNVAKVGGVWHYDLATRKLERWVAYPGARHDKASADNRLVVYDDAPGKWWRGCPWRVCFYNRDTARTVEVYSTRPALMPATNQSRLHPDPHPHFACRDRYIVSTANNAWGTMELYVTPVDQLVRLTTMDVPKGRRVEVVNPLDVGRGSETVTLNWKDFGLSGETPAMRVWEVGACRPVAWQDIGKGRFIFATALGPKEKKVFVVGENPSLPQANLDTVCWSQFLPERMDDFAWENDKFGARAYGPIIMQPAPKGQKLVSSGIDIINKCVHYPVLHRWFVQRTGEGSYHKDHGEGMDNYKVGPSRGCGGLGALAGTDGWRHSINWSKSRTLMNGPVRTVFELTYPAWGGLGEEKRVVTLDRGQFFAHYRSTFAGKVPEGVKVGPGLDCAKERQHNGKIQRDLAQGWIANWEPDNVDGPDTGNIATAVLLAPSMGAATTAVDKLGCEYLFPASAAKGVDYWAGATWVGSHRTRHVRDAADWHRRVKAFADGLRAPVKVTIQN